MTVKRIQPGKRMSQAVVAGGLVFVAGQVSKNKAGGSVAEQTQDILSIIDGLLAEAGSDKSKLVSANIWLTDIATFDEMNKVWDGWTAENAAPARATVEAKLAAPQFKVEIAVVAAT
jgi:enamine deaminase RidA (YjgF/YER057c/UK114 family)